MKQFLATGLLLLLFVTSVSQSNGQAAKAKAVSAIPERRTLMTRQCGVSRSSSRPVTKIVLF